MANSNNVRQRASRASADDDDEMDASPSFYKGIIPISYLRKEDYRRSPVFLLNWFYNTVVIDLNYVLRWAFIKDVLLVATILFIENALVFFTSTIKIPAEEPLTDLIRDVLRKNNTLKYWVHWGKEYHYGDIFIVFWILLPLLFRIRGARILHRGVRTLQLTRFLRWFTFTMTILPSSHGPSCQIIRGFRNLPEVFSAEWFRFGILNFRFGGGCYDLLFSGHTVMYVLFNLTLWALFKKLWVRLFVCLPITLVFIQRCFRTVEEGHHYTVDMVVAIYLTALVWFVPYATKGVYPARLRAEAELFDEDLGQLDEENEDILRKTEIGKII